MLRISVRSTSFMPKSSQKILLLFTLFACYISVVTGVFESGFKINFTWIHPIVALEHILFSLNTHLCKNTSRTKRRL